MTKDATKGKNSKVLLSVRDLCISFPRPDRSNKMVVDHVSFTLSEGEILGVAGESGSGKSMTALAVMGLLPENAKYEASELGFLGQSLLFSNRKKEEEVRCRLSGSEMAMIFQEPLTSLNPVQTIGTQMEEPLLLHAGQAKEARRELILEALASAGLRNPSELLNQYPHQLSGGMRQRVMIAMALINGPKLLIADEPTTALDVVIEQEIVELIRTLAKERQLSVIFISHNLNVLQKLCDRLIVMKDGKIVEEGSTEQVFSSPVQDYTKKLMSAVVSGPKERAKENAGKETKESTETEAVLRMEELSVIFRKKTSMFHAPLYKTAVNKVSLSVGRGEIFGIVGESGCGKSTLLKTIAGLQKASDGTLSVSQTEAGVQMVFQDPYTSLNPAKKVGWILEEPLRLHTKLTKQERKERVLSMLAETELLPEIAGRHISELSGGQRQRVAIAAALILNPELVLLDEPVSALDVTVQAQILALLLRLQREHGLTYVFVSHDMAVVRKLCDTVMVMKDGRMIECGPAEQVFLNPKEDYTKKLIGSAKESGK